MERVSESEARISCFLHGDVKKTSVFLVVFGCCFGRAEFISCCIFGANPERHCHPNPSLSGYYWDQNLFSIFQCL